MNIQTTPAVEAMCGEDRINYKAGHRDARHAAADLALKADAEREAMLNALQAILPYIPKTTASEFVPAFLLAQITARCVGSGSANG